jgi:hypothetical protein
MRRTQASVTIGLAHTARVGIAGRQLEPWQELAAAVIHQAVLDARQPFGARERLRALTFLRDSPDLRWWCGVAGLDPDLVAAMAAHTVHQTCGPDFG